MRRRLAAHRRRRRLGLTLPPPGTPYAVRIIPADNNATGVIPDANIWAKFPEAIKARPMNTNTFGRYQGNFTYEGGH